MTREGAIMAGKQLKQCFPNFYAKMNQTKKEALLAELLRAINLPDDLVLEALRCDLALRRYPPSINEISAAAAEYADSAYLRWRSFQALENLTYNGPGKEYFANLTGYRQLRRDAGIGR